MANARCEMQILKRSAGRSVVAAAAYRSGDRLDDRRTGEVHDYERRGGVMHSEIVLPDNAPESMREWAGDREQLWNRVEETENRKNSQLARELLVSMPHELSEDARRGLVLDYAQHIADTYGFAVDASIHAPGGEGDDRNHHAHLLFSNRPLDEETESGFSKNKDRRFDNIAMQRSGGENEVEDLRHQWQELCNDALRREDIRDARGGLVQVDLRSYERQGIERETGEHEGVEATQIRRQGGQTDIGQENDAKRERNAEREELEQQIDGSREAIADELKAIHRTPDEDKIKYAFHDNETVQGIFSDLDRAGQGYSYQSRSGLFSHHFRAGYSRKLAEFNAELEADAPSNRGVGRADFLQDLADAMQHDAQGYEAEDQRRRDLTPADPGYYDPLLKLPATEGELLDTDPRPRDPGEDDPLLKPEPETLTWGGWKR